MDWKNRSAYVFIKTVKGKSNEVWKQFHNWDNVIGTWIVDGEWDVIVWFDATDWDIIRSCVETIKGWKEVEHTSSHMVYNGWKNGGWWWEQPAGAWVLLRENKLGEVLEKMHNWDWTVSGASIPGDWDYMTWVGGKNWDEVWKHLVQIKKEKWETTTQVPIKSWWNEKWKEQWW